MIPMQSVVESRTGVESLVHALAQDRKVILARWETQPKGGTPTMGVLVACR